MRLLSFAMIGTALAGLVAHVGMPVLFALANASALFFEGGTVPGVSFAPDKGLELDIYTPARGPATPPGDPVPVVVFFHGGSWSWGARGDYPFAGVTLASEGFVAVIPDYRKYPDVKFPAFVEDGAEAVAWVRENIAPFGGDPDRIYLMGHSAGAHIAALLTMDERYLAGTAAEGAVRGLIGMSGPYDFAPESASFIDMFGPPERFDQMQLPTFVDGGEPPMLLMHGIDDAIVDLRHSDELAALVRDAGGCVRTRFYPDYGHVGVMSAFSWVFRETAPMVGDVVAFLNRDAGAPC